MAELILRSRGRPPRILHIGNIANNAYLNAKILNTAGLNCDVLCYDYYHVMGCPEWEDTDFDGEIDDRFRPDWSLLDLNGFKRPKWFAQGPLGICVKYFSTKYSGNLEQEKLYGVLLRHEDHTSPIKIRTARFDVVRALFFFKISRFYCRIKRFMFSDDFVGRLKSRLAPLRDRNTHLETIVFVLLYGMLLIMRVIAFPFLAGYSRRISRQVERALGSKLPGNLKSCIGKDIASMQVRAEEWRGLLSYYDLVHAYATDGIYPLLAEKPYVAYEHGTIRNIPFEDTTQGRLCAITYKNANHVCITNADNIESAKKLGLNNYTFVPHPINEEFLAPDEKSGILRSSIRKEFDSDFVVFHPSRQHWEQQRHPDWEKGNDIFIRGFARFIKEVNPNAAAVFVEWGKFVDKSKSLLEELNITDRVMWIPPQPNRKMIRYIHATDLLADQFYLGAFGSTMPKALACGRPAMLYLNEEIHNWCFDEMPPVINTRTDREVFEGLKKLYADKAWRHQLVEDGKTWYRKYHSNDVILHRLLQCYEKALSVSEGS